MNNDKVTCEACKYCDRDKAWCSVKALAVTVMSKRNCKVYAPKAAQVK